MKNSFGSQISVSVFGESHGKSVGVVIDGLAPGIAVDINAINRFMSLRKPADSASRCECDEVIIESGVFKEKTTGTPLTIRIENKDIISNDYDAFSDIPRPGHADYTALVKYNGFNNPYGGGHTSGRITAGIVAAGGIIIPALKAKGIDVFTRIYSINGNDDRMYAGDIETLKEVCNSDFPVLSDDKRQEYMEIIRSAKEAGDSIGGILETFVTGIPAGIGEPWFDTMEGLISHAVFSVPGVKGIEFGDGFDIANKMGSEANDCYVLNNDRVECSSNHNGGILGGITNGMPVVFRTAIKPTPTIAKEQDTLNTKTKCICSLSGTGRHDACIVPRARVVVDSVTALVVADAMSIHFGTDWLAK